MPADTPPPPTPKHSLRQSIRRRRRHLPSADRRLFNIRICAHLLQWLSQQEFDAVAAYMATDGEVDITAALHEIHQQGMVVYLPVIDPLRDGHMQFCQWSPEVPMTHNRFGIPEPVATPPVHLSDLDCVLMPLVGFTVGGERLGMGGGYYDRCFGQPAAAASPVRVGIAYALQEVERVHREPWDITMHHVITENGWFTFEH